MKIITSGDSYIDIDAYACAVAYAELLQRQGVDACAYTSAVLNESISKTVRGWSAPILRDLLPTKQDTFVIVDLSDPKYVDRVVDLSRVEEVIDHHVGFEDYWRDRIGEAARIEFIGAACTLVFEGWKKAGLLHKMSQISARLLVCGILDNTLNFGANVTTERDVAAYNALLPIAQLPEDWPAQYFTECESSIIVDPVNALQNDMKTVMFKTFPDAVSIGQMTVWDARKVLSDNHRQISTEFGAAYSDWFVNAISISDKKSYFVASTADLREWLRELLGVQFSGKIGFTDHSWLRKEIIKRDMRSE